MKSQKTAMNNTQRPPRRTRVGVVKSRLSMAISEKARRHIDSMSRDSSGNPSMNMKDYLDIMVDVDRKRLGMEPSKN